MARSIHRTIIAAVALAAVLITALGASQARAQGRDTERALAALLGLAVVGAIIANQRDDDQKSHSVTRNRPDHRDGRSDGYRRVEPRPLPHRAHRQVLPRDCLREVRTRHGGTMRVYPAHCLDRAYPFARTLPRQCAQEVRGGRGRSIVWGAHCLERQGYRVSRR